ncbi:MAG TPA: hypothetical protein V6C99_05305, partial [Oculatellaceae cyanobacterium]
RLTALKKKYQSKRRVLYEDKISGDLDADMWREMDREALEQIQMIEVQLSKVTQADTIYQETITKALELPEMLSVQWVSGNQDEKKEFLKFVYSNFSVKDGNAHLVLKEELLLLRKMGVLKEVRK